MTHQGRRPWRPPNNGLSTLSHGSTRRLDWTPQMAMSDPGVTDADWREAEAAGVSVAAPTLRLTVPADARIG